MQFAEFNLKSLADGLDLQGYRWSPAAPVAALVLSHGAAEHALRYQRLGAALNADGIELWAIDQRGHGRSLGPGGIGELGEARWAGLVADLRQLTEHVREQRPRLPLCLMGHSMGSFAALHLTLDSSQLIDALVLSGSTAVQFPPRGTRPAFTPNEAFEPARTPYDWLSRDPAEVDKYIADPLCGFETGRRNMDAAAVRALSDPARLSQIRSELPVLLLAGDADPVNRNLDGLHRLEQRLREAGVRRVDTLYYAGGRHEMLNETNRDQVTADLIAWVHDALGA